MQISRRMQRGLAASGVLVALAIGGCTATYSEAELQAQDRKEDAAVRDEARRDGEIGQEGGVNQEAIDEQEEEFERESDL